MALHIRAIMKQEAMKMNAVILTVVFTLIIYWTVGIIIALIDENKLVYWATGLMYPIILVITYPIRAINTYNHSYSFYQKHNISLLQYIFGKRVHQKRKNKEGNEGE